MQVWSKDELTCQSNQREREREREQDKSTSSILNTYNFFWLIKYVQITKISAGTTNLCYVVFFFK